MADKVKDKISNAISPDSSKQIPMYSPEFFMNCAIGGVAACGPTHSLLTPLDLIKCRRQVDPKLYSSNLQAFRKILSTPGDSIFLGLGATAIGYSIQGAGKYGFYELFKYKYTQWLGPETGHKYKTAVYLAASASAEFLIDIGLCPFETIKVKTQTTIPPYATSVLDGWKKIVQAEGLTGLYKGIVPLWGRQVPYTMAKFTLFESAVSAIYSYIDKKPSDCNFWEKTGVSFLGGYTAGVGCAVISHPADVLVSMVSSDRKSNESLVSAVGRMYKQIGFMGLWNGLPVRIFMIGTLTAFQWLIYDSFKVYVGLPTTGGEED